MLLMMASIQTLSNHCGVLSDSNERIWVRCVAEHNMVSKPHIAHLLKLRGFVSDYRHSG